MRIKSFIARLTVLAVLLAPLTVLAQGNPTADFTTLNGAITTNATTLVLTSASASAGSSFGAPAVGHCLYIDRELMRITAISSTTVTIQHGTINRGPHANSAVIFIGVCGAGNFKNIDPPNVSGNQICLTQPAPWINTNTGMVWWCNAPNSLWKGFTATTITYNSVPTAP